MKKALLLAVCSGLMISSAQPYVKRRVSVKPSVTKEQKAEVGRVRKAWENFKKRGSKFVPGRRAAIAGGVVAGTVLAGFAARVAIAIISGDRDTVSILRKAASHDFTPSEQAVLDRLVKEYMDRIGWIPSIPKFSMPELKMPKWPFGKDVTPTPTATPTETPDPFPGFSPFE